MRGPFRILHVIALMGLGVQLSFFLRNKLNYLHLEMALDPLSIPMMEVVCGL